jgi:hypothetical protein
MLLDNFTGVPPYTKPLLPGQSDLHTLPILPPLKSRQTSFSCNVAPNQWNQPCTLEIGTQNGTGILILNAGLGAVCPGFLNYGTFQEDTAAAPLGWNLSASAFQLNFAGLSASVDLVVIISVKVHNSSQLHDQQSPALFPTQSAFPVSFPFAAFVPPLPSPSDIDGIQIHLQTGGLTVTFGITSFEALP